MKLLRKKSVLSVLAGLLIVGLVGGYFGGRYILKRRILAWRAQGIAASKAGDHATAADLLVRYLQRRDGDEEALSYYIRSREAAELPNGQHLAQTIAALKMLLGENPNRVDDRRHLLELLAKLDQRPEAIATADALLAQTKGEDVRALQLKTEVLMRPGVRRDHDALAAAEQWAQKTHDQDIRALMARTELKARLLLEADKGTGASGAASETVIDDVRRLREAHPDDARFELLQGFAYAQVGDEAQAMNWLKTAASHPDLSQDLAAVLIKELDKLGLSDRSLSVLQNLVKNGAGEDVKHLLGRRLWELSRWQDAADVLAPLDPYDPASDPTLIAVKATALAAAGHKLEAQDCRAALSGRPQSAAKAWNLILSRELDGASPDDKQILTECRSALAADPYNSYLTYYYGDSQARLGDTDVAINVWQRVVLDNPTWAIPGVRLVEALLQKGRTQQAIMVATSVQRHNQTQAAAAAILARACSAGIDSGAIDVEKEAGEELLNYANAVQKQVPADDQTLILRVQILVNRGKKADAVDAARAAMTRTPPVAEQALIGLAYVSRKFGMDVQDELFNRSEQLWGLTPTLAYARAADALTAGDAKRGLQVFDEQAKRSGKSNEQAWQWQRARYLDVAGSSDARGAWVALGDAYPEDEKVQFAVASAQALRGDWDVGTRTIDRLRKILGENSRPWRLAQARLYIDAPRGNDDYEKAALLLDALIKQQPELSEPHVLLARALVQMKRIDGAIQHLTTAAQLDPTSVPIALQLASLLQSRGDFERVNKEMDRVAPLLRNNAGERRQAAALLAQSGKDDEALKLLEPEAGRSSGGDIDDQMLALLYKQRGQLDKAETIVGKLLDRPSLANVQFAASFFAAQGRRADAEQALAKLEQLKLEPGMKELAWASYLGQVGDYAEAAKHFQAATNESPTNPVAWRGLAVAKLVSGRGAELSATLDAAAKALPEDKGFATLKAQASLLQTSATDPSLLLAALQIIRDPQQALGALELLKLSAEARQSQDRERYVSGLLQLIEREPTLVAAHEQLVNCYCAAGQFDKAASAAKDAMTALPSDPEAARLATRVFASTGRWTEVREAAQAWQKRSPNASAAADLMLARADVAQKDYPAAVRRLSPYLQTAKRAPDEYRELLAVYAVALVNAGDAQAAADLLLPLSQRSLGWRTQPALIALDVDDAGAATAWLDRIKQNLAPDANDAEWLALALACQRRGSGLEGRPKEPALLDRAAKIFARMTARPTVAPATLLAAASTAEMIGDAAAAEGYYRRAVAIDPKLWIAQNNLAALLCKVPGKLPEATQFASAAVDARPGEPEVRDTMAMVQAKSGDFKAAAASVQEAVKLDPNNPKWRIRLAQYLVQGGEVLAAANALNALELRRTDFARLSPALEKDLQAVREEIRQKRSS